MKRVIIESPYAGNIERNVRYARAALRHSLLLGEAPLASHLLHTQPGVLEDQDAAQRAMGIAAGLAWTPVADLVALYMDLGISAGMRKGLEAAQRAGIPVAVREIPGWELAELQRPI